MFQIYSTNLNTLFEELTIQDKAKVLEEFINENIIKRLNQEPSARVSSSYVSNNRQELREIYAKLTNEDLMTKNCDELVEMLFEGSSLELKKILLNSSPSIFIKLITATLVQGFVKELVDTNVITTSRNTIRNML